MRSRRKHNGQQLTLGCVFFCVGNSCFLRRWLVFVFFATVAVGGVFCNGGGCFLRRSWWEGMFFATAGHVFCIGRVCFLHRWCFFATVTYVFCDGWRGPPPGALFCG